MPSRFQVPIFSHLWGTHITWWSHFSVILAQIQHSLSYSDLPFEGRPFFGHSIVLPGYVEFPLQGGLWSATLGLVRGTCSPCLWVSCWSCMEEHCVCMVHLCFWSFVCIDSVLALCLSLCQCEWYCHGPYVYFMLNPSKAKSKPCGIPPEIFSFDRNSPLKPAFSCII